MNKDGIKRNIAIEMNEAITGEKNPNEVIEDIESVLRDAEEIKEFAELLLYAIKNYIKN